VGRECVIGNLFTCSLLCVPANSLYHALPWAEIV